jgi:hypothetical protein
MTQGNVVDYKTEILFSLIGKICRGGEVIEGEGGEGIS